MSRGPEISSDGKLWPLHRPEDGRGGPEITAEPHWGSTRGQSVESCAQHSKYPTRYVLLLPAFYIWGQKQLYNFPRTQLKSCRSSPLNHLSEYKVPAPTSATTVCPSNPVEALKCRHSQRYCPENNGQNQHDTSPHATSSPLPGGRSARSAVFPKIEEETFPWLPSDVFFTSKMEPWVLLEDVLVHFPEDQRQGGGDLGSVVEEISPHFLSEFVGRPSSTSSKASWGSDWCHNRIDSVAGHWLVLWVSPWVKIYTDDILCFCLGPLSILSSVV